MARRTRHAIRKDSAAVAEKKTPIETQTRGIATATESPAERAIRRLKQRRLFLRQTLQQVCDDVEDRSAGAVTISAPQLSRIESNLGNPSLEQLHWLNEVLDKPLGGLFSETDSQQERPWFILRRQNIRKRLQEIADGKLRNIRFDKAHHDLQIDGQQLYRYVPLELDDNEPDGFVEASDRGIGFKEHFARAFLFQVEPERFSKFSLDTLDSHAGEEIIYVLKGELEFLTESSDGQLQVHKLGEGDCLRFSSELRHAFRSGDRHPAEALFVFTNRPTVQPVEEVIEVVPAKSAKGR